MSISGTRGALLGLYLIKWVSIWSQFFISKNWEQGIEVVNIFLHRCSTAKAFLRPIRHRPNLHIAMNSQVIKVCLTNISAAIRNFKPIQNFLFYFQNVANLHHKEKAALQDIAGVMMIDQRI